MASPASAENDLLYQCELGDRAYGLDFPKPRLRLRGLFAAPPSHVMTPFFPLESIHGPGEREIYEVGSFIKRVVDQQPEALEMLWVLEGRVSHRSPAAELLRRQRKELLSKKTYSSFSGAADALRRQLDQQFEWLHKPQPRHPPLQARYTEVLWYAPDCPEGSRDGSWCRAVQVGQDTYALYAWQKDCQEQPAAWDWWGDNGQVLLSPSEAFEGRHPDLVVHVNVRDYQKAHKLWEQYWAWKARMDQETDCPERRCGYDTATAMEMIRLQRMGRELLTEGQLWVHRPDRRELMDIRAGLIPYPDMMALWEEEDSKLKQAHADSPLPPGVDPFRAAELLTEIYRRCWGFGGRARGLTGGLKRLVGRLAG
ncbi:MAG: nucleotidyltransferase domain-containing protein [Candidatus Competibacteraceae bacterium]|nr:nucleotidyltransferase domain-containing protein [Candidatus Competibacteraceae bacterium]